MIAILIRYEIVQCVVGGSEHDFHFDRLDELLLDDLDMVAALTDQLDELFLFDLNDDEHFHNKLLLDDLNMMATFMRNFVERLEYDGCFDQLD